MRVVVVAALAAGCYNPSPPSGAPCTDDTGCPSGQRCIGNFCGGSTSEVDASTSDAAADAPGCDTWSPKFFDACAIPAPLGDLVLSDTLSTFNWDTSSGQLKGKMNTDVPVATMVLAQSDGTEVLLASVGNFHLEQGAVVDVSGTRPLLIAVHGTAALDGAINLNAIGVVAGPGGNPLACGTSTGRNGASGAPGKGGAGGGFQGAGGAGGNGGGAAGDAIATPALIRGGCAGGVGGAGTGFSGSRGGGGGALHIAARGTIAITANGTINAGGGGGGYGRLAYGAGGGGGSGGFIGLEGTSVIVTGGLYANGGGGGGGASDLSSAQSGQGGTTSTTAATGGPGGSPSGVGTCSRGGVGSAGSNRVGETGMSSNCGGGGGGGGAGYIVVWSQSPTITGEVSPDVTTGQ